MPSAAVVSIAEGRRRGCRRKGCRPPGSSWRQRPGLGEGRDGGGPGV